MNKSLIIIAIINLLTCTISLKPMENQFAHDTTIELARKIASIIRHDYRTTKEKIAGIQAILSSQDKQNKQIILNQDVSICRFMWAPTWRPLPVIITESGSPKLIRFLIEQGADTIEVLIKAIQDNNLPAAQLLVKNGALSLLPRDSKKILMQAIEENNLPIARLFVNNATVSLLRGADIKKVLIQAIKDNNVPIARLLAKNGALSLLRDTLNSHELDSNQTDILRVVAQESEELAGTLEALVALITQHNLPFEISLLIAALLDDTLYNNLRDTTIINGNTPLMDVVNLGLGRLAQWFLTTSAVTTPHKTVGNTALSISQEQQQRTRQELINNTGRMRHILENPQAIVPIKKEAFEK